MRKKKPCIILTPGDPEGLGPELLVKAFRKGGFPKEARYLIVGALEPFRRLRFSVPLSEEHGFFSLPIQGIPAPLPKADDPLHPGGFQSGWAIEKSVKLLMDGRADALVTGPIHKKHLNLGGFPFPGHTDFLGHLSGAPQVTMMMANDALKVTLVNAHTSIANASSSLTQERIQKAIHHTVDYLKRWWNLPHPRVAVLGLNPHAGEEGLLGDEEEKMIVPAILASTRLWGRTATISGPFPADTFFALENLKPKKLRVDAVVCMYHDQGLIPVKLLDFFGTVQISLGLPFIRTSVDHGVGFDIVGTGKANPTSFIRAVKLAHKIIQLSGEDK